MNERAEVGAVELTAEDAPKITVRRYISVGERSVEIEVQGITDHAFALAILETMIKGATQ